MFMRVYYTIRDLTREFGITARTLRYYEEEGLLQPLRRGNSRLYTQLDYNRIQQILRSKRLGFSLKEIAALFVVTTKQPQKIENLRQLLDHIEQQRLRIGQMRSDIDQTLRELDGMEETLFERLAELGVSH